LRAYCVGVHVLVHGPASAGPVISAPRLVRHHRNCDQRSLYEQPTLLSTVFAMMEKLETRSRGPSIWTRPERSARGPSPEHSRAEIASAGVVLADANGLGAVTMRSVAAAIGTAPASLYRYVATRHELVELMADQVYGEYSCHETGSGHPGADLLRLAHQGRAIYHRHPWLLDIPATGNLPGPNAVAFIEGALAVLAGANLTGPARLETIGLFSGALRLFAQTEIGQQRAGQEATQWQDSLAGYLLHVAADGDHPHLAAALADQPAAADPAQHEPVFDRAMTRILTGLLPPPEPPRPPPRH
jgi:AcrR family transcriptional regulator